MSVQGNKKPSVIRVGNIGSQLVTDNPVIIKTLVKAFKFKSPTCFYDPLYKRHLWDGFTEFFDKEGRFLTGLLPEVEEVLQKMKCPYVLQSAVNPVKWKTPPHERLIEVTDKEGNTHPLRDYQHEFMKVAATSHRGIIKAATGAGKTAIIAGLVKMTASPGQDDYAPTLIMMRNRTLAYQTQNELKGMGINVGIVHGEVWDPQTVTIVLFQSAHKIDSLIPYIELLIVDEVHESAGKQGLQLYKKARNTYTRFGLSATPFKSKDQVHNYRIMGHFGPMLGEVLTGNLQDRGILSKSLVHIYLIDEPHDPKYEALDYQSAYDLLVVNNEFFHQRVVDIVKERCRGRTLIIVERIEHGDQLSAMIPGSLWIQGKDNDETRNWVREQLRNGPGDIVAIATRIFTTGIDLRIHNLINCAGMKAEITTIQRFGRGLRPASDKELLDYYDFYFTTNKYLEKHSRERIKLLKREGHAFVLEDEEVAI